MRFRNPFNISPAKATTEDAMVALYGILHMHEKAGGEPLHLPLADATFAMEGYHSTEVAPKGPRCGTAACAAGSAALVPWFHKLAKAKGLDTIMTPANSDVSQAVIDESFVDNPELWGDAYNEMSALFHGDSLVYGRDRALVQLTVDEVKTALRGIVFQYYGAKGVERCEAMDRQACIVIK